MIECWNMFEVVLKGPKKNAYLEVGLEARFENEKGVKKITGFYNGNGNYIIRFMPEFLGEWTFVTSSNRKELDGEKGVFVCVKASILNHGPVRVSNQYHFAYADGERYFPFGTTCYAWIHQSITLQKQTLGTLKNAPFNKLRMCVFPKYYSNNTTESEMYPFVKTEDGAFDFSEFNPDFFDHLDNMVEKLMQMNIEADFILFHPYDKGHWGFDRMTKEQDKGYLNYIVARYAAYRNIWWSMANEYDYMEEKTIEDWNEYIELVSKADSYNHLLSIHQGDLFFNNFNPYITHSCIQLGTLKGAVNVGFGVYKAHRDIFKKPVIYDEVGYEGDLIQRWGRNTAKELIDKYWMAAVSGVYMGHGETFQDPEDIIWWSKGGVLKGKSPERIRFLKKVIESSGLNGLNPIDKWWILNGAGKGGKYYLFYFGEQEIAQWKFELPAFMTSCDISMGTRFSIDIIDTWEMTILPVEGEFEITEKNRYSYLSSNRPFVNLPEKPYIAIRIKRIEEE